MNSCHYSSLQASSLIVVDASVANPEILLENVGISANILMLDPDQDGIEQISQMLATVKSVESLHILAHGHSGMLQLGTTHFSWQTFDRYTNQLKAWANSLQQGAEILLYSCEVAAGTLGQWFVQQLKSLTGAEVAASSSLIGNPALGGNWNLEYRTGTIRTAIAFADTAIAAYPHVLAVLVSDLFRGSDVTEKSWKVGTGAPGSEPLISPFLTARNSTTAGLGGIPGNPDVQLDPEGEGALRLTTNRADQSAFVLFDRAIGSRQGLTVTFELYSYGGTLDLTADGLSFFLLDGQVSPDQAGAFGGSLGYAQKNVTTTTGLVPGLTGAYVGIGFDEFGNFSSATDFSGGEVVRTGGAAERVPDSIGVRAGEVTNYQYVTGTGSLPFGIDVPTATNRDEAKRTVKIDLTTNGLLTVRIDSNNDGDFLDPGESSPALTNFNIANINGTIPPETLKFGFASGTGRFNNIHEIRKLVVSTLNNPPTAIDFSKAVPPSQARQLTGFAGTDPDTADGDSIASFSILTLPDASQGTLYRGNPANGGTAITSLPSGGLTLTPTEIQNIYFRANGTFQGTTFTYTVTDSRGSSDETAAIVTLKPDVGGEVEGEIEGRVCLPGKTLRGKNNRNDKIDGTENIDRIFGLSGNDRLRGLDCNDRIDGGRGNDKLLGGAFSDRLRGQQNKDSVRGNGGDDVLDLGLGNDRGYGGRGNDVGQGRRGNDRLEGRGGDDTLFGGRGNDRIFGNSNNDSLDGQQGNDLVRGDQGNDTLNGGLGSDRLRGTGRSDVIFGRRGNDTAWGGVGADRLLGQGGNDRLSGNPQADILNGGKGNDVLNGGTGDDRIRTGVGSDRIFYRSAQQGFDTIFGFNVNVDVIDLRQVFRRPEYTSDDPFADYVRLSNSANGAILRVDGDGAAPGNFVRLAILRNVEAATLNATTNFLV